MVLSSVKGLGLMGVPVQDRHTTPRVLRKWGTDRTSDLMPLEST